MFIVSRMLFLKICSQISRYVLCINTILNGIIIYVFRKYVHFEHLHVSIADTPFSFHSLLLDWLSEEKSNKAPLKISSHSNISPRKRWESWRKERLGYIFQPLTLQGCICLSHATPRARWFLSLVMTVVMAPCCCQPLGAPPCPGLRKQFLSGFLFSYSFEHASDSFWESDG